jgi:hypothetical protein
MNGTRDLSIIAERNHQASVTNCSRRPAIEPTAGASRRRQQVGGLLSYYTGRLRKQRTRSGMRPYSIAVRLLKNRPRQLPSPNFQLPNHQNPGTSIPVGCWASAVGVDHGFFSTL